MTKEQLEQLVRLLIGELRSASMPESQAHLTIGFIEEIRKIIGNTYQSDDFANELMQRLEELEQQ